MKYLEAVFCKWKVIRGTIYLIVFSSKCKSGFQNTENKYNILKMFPAMFARWFLKNNEAFKEKGKKFMHNAPYVLSRLAGLKPRHLLGCYA